VINGRVVGNVVALRIQRSRRGASERRRCLVFWEGCVYGGWVGAARSLFVFTRPDWVATATIIGCDGSRRWYSEVGEGGR